MFKVSVLQANLWVMRRKYSKQLKEMMRREVMEKGWASSIAFTVFAIMIFFYKFGCIKYSYQIQWISCLLLLVSFLRLKLIYNFRHDQALNERRYLTLRILVFLNMIGWSSIFSLSTIEHQFEGIHYMVSVTMMCGFISSSIITLSADMLLYLPFQVFLLAPQIVYVCYDAIVRAEYKLAPMAFVYSIYLAYQLKQVKDFRHKVESTFISQLDLIDSNKELKLSQEVQLEQAMKLIHTSRLAALGEMSAGIAHEVNNPLAIISASLQQMERKIERGDYEDSDLLRLSNRSQGSIERITNIIRGLRHFSQQTDAQPKQKVALAAIISDTLDFCQEMLKARYVRLEVATVPQVDVNCHPVQISQVLINLIKNAEDALVDVQDPAERWVKLDFELKEQGLLLHVRNGGPKISADLTEKLFQPFFTTKGVGKGTGLGLSISRGIMREHGGDLSYNETEKCTTFTLKLQVNASL